MTVSNFLHINQATTIKTKMVLKTGNTRVLSAIGNWSMLQNVKVLFPWLKKNADKMNANKNLADPDFNQIKNISERISVLTPTEHKQHSLNSAHSNMKNKIWYNFKERQFPQYEIEIPRNKLERFVTHTDTQYDLS